MSYEINAASYELQASSCKSLDYLSRPEPKDQAAFPLEALAVFPLEALVAYWLVVCDLNYA